MLNINEILQTFNRFADRTEEIKALLKNDATFRNICTDYEVICAWLADHCRLHGRPSKKCDHARELVRKLEGDIIRALDSEAGG